MQCVVRTRDRRGQAGFSLLEMVLVCVLALVALGALCSVWQLGVRSWEVAEGRAALQQELRRGNAFMADDLMQCGRSTITGCPADNNWHESITFRLPAGMVNGEATWSNDAVTYSLGGLDNRQVIRTEGNVQRVVANKVSTFSVRRQAATPGLLEVLLRAQEEAAIRPGEKCLSAELSAKINLRN